MVSAGKSNVDGAASRIINGRNQPIRGAITLAIPTLEHPGAIAALQADELELASQPETSRGSSQVAA